MTRLERLLETLILSNTLGKRLEILEQLVVEESVKTSTIMSATRWKDYQVRHYIRLINRLCPDVRYLIEQNKISFGLARAIASLPMDKQEKAARDAIAKKISVHSFRAKQQSSDNLKLIRDLDRLSDEYSGVTGLDIKINPDKQNPNAGAWIIRYFDLDMFDTIRDKLGIRSD